MLYFPQPPLDTPPPGGDQDKAPLLRTVIGIELCVCTIVVVARLYTRLMLVRNAGWDDGIMLATFVWIIDINQMYDFLEAHAQRSFVRPSDLP